MAFKVYYTDTTFPTLDPARQELARVGAELIVADAHTEQDVVEQCADADALVLAYTPISHTVLSNLKNLKVVVRCGIGVDVIDLEACTEHGVCAVNIPDYCIPEVSDHALAFILACARKIMQLDRAVHAGVWAARETAKPVQRLDEQTAGVIGFGRIGSRLGRNLRALGFRVLAYDPYLADEEIVARGGEPSTLENLLQQADYVSINCPLSKETFHMIGKEELALMKPTAFVVNTARGAVIDEAALIAALQAGQIAGAALDVLEQEPPAPDNPLLSMANVIVTPHAAYYSERSSSDLIVRTAQEAARVLSGYYPRSLVNPAVKERLAAMGRALKEA